MARLELRGVGKTYRGGIKGVGGVDLAVESGELGVIIGPSGSGKSTLLRLIAGLETLDAGSIHLDGRRIDGLPPRDRGLAMVFQDVVVYPHLNVFENIAFGLRARRVGPDEVRARVEATAAQLGLDAVLGRSPTTLSGGQRRRVTLARALVVRPRLMLLDEPFSGLDAPLRAAIRAEIADLHRQTGATMILVTHDQAEALALADRLAVVHNGQILQVGRPLDVYDRPAHVFVGQAVGLPPMAFLRWMVEADGPDAIRLRPPSDSRPEAGPGAMPPWAIPRAWGALFDRLTDHVGRWVALGLRAEHVAIVSPSETTRPGLISALATVVRLEPTGHEVVVTLRLGPNPITMRVQGRPTIRVGDAVAAAIDLAGASWFDVGTSDRIG